MPMSEKVEMSLPQPPLPYFSAKDKSNPDTTNYKHNNNKDDFTYVLVIACTSLRRCEGVSKLNGHFDCT